MNHKYKTKSWPIHDLDLKNENVLIGRKFIAQSMRAPRTFFIACCRIPQLNCFVNTYRYLFHLPIGLALPFCSVNAYLAIPFLILRSEWLVSRISSSH